MKKITLELNLPEAIKLIAVCNEAIENTENTVQNLHSSHAKEMAQQSIRCIKMLKYRIRDAITQGREKC